MRAALVLRDGVHNPATRIRMLDLVPLLEARGVEIRTHSWSPRSRWEVGGGAAAVLQLARWADVVVLQRPNQPIALVRALARVNPHLVVDIDDALWVTSDDRYAPRFGSRIEHAVRSARVVTPGSEYLAAWARRLSPRAEVVVVRSAVDTEAVLPHEPTSPGVPTAIWIGSPGNFADFDDEVSTALREAVAAGRLQVRIVSSEPFDPVPSELVPWSSAAEVRALATADIGLMPLRDTRRSRGRCGFKAIQYMAAGLPVIASDVGVAPELVTSGETGLLVGSDVSWAGALTTLIAEPDRRSAMGMAGRAWVETHASRDVSADRMVEALQRAAS